MSAAYTKFSDPQGSDAWLKRRERYFNASKAGVLYDADPYTTKLQYAEEKMFGAKQDTKGKEKIFEAGHLSEEQSRKYANENLGFNFVPTVIVSNRVLDLMASTDGMDEEQGVGLEAKLTGLETLHKIKNGDYPKHHIYQIQAQLLASGFDRWIYMPVHKGQFLTINIQPDKELHKRMADDIYNFMQACRDGELPEPSDRDYFEPNDSRFEDLIQLKKLMDQSADNFEKLKADLVKDFSLYSRVRYRELMMIKTTRKGNISYAKIPELKAVDLEKYRGAPITSVSVKFGKAK